MRITNLKQKNMKNLISITLLLLSINCKAQSPIVDIIDLDGTRQTNAYYKDVNNLLNPFEGTYIYTNGSTSFKIVLVKKELQAYNGYYEDLIIGEYQYILNGVQIANTLSEINTNYPNQRTHKIDGNFLVNKNHRAWKCPSCGATELRLRATIQDIISNKFATLIMRRTTEGGHEVMKINILHISGDILVEGEPVPLEFALPIGEFTLIKQ